MILHHAEVRRQTRKGSNLRAQGEKVRVAWACGSHEGAKEPPRSQGARRFAAHTRPPRGATSLAPHHGRLAGALGSGLAGQLPSPITPGQASGHKRPRRPLFVTCCATCRSASCKSAGRSSARRRTLSNVEKREVQATRMKAPPSASVGGHPCPRQRRCKMRRCAWGILRLRFIRWLCFHPLFMARTVHRAGSYRRTSFAAIAAGALGDFPFSGWPLRQSIGLFAC